ncbi:MAG: RNA methyltransferase [Bacteroidales bacterium]|nr:RNA methyltransferase [Bacteroidales bacterium]
MDSPTRKLVIGFLSDFVTPARLEKIQQVLSGRTRHVTIVLEDIYQPQNASAVLRSCECFGVQDVHIIENRNEYEINPEVVMGANKWLNLHRYSDGEFNTKTCLTKLKQQGYQLVATSPHEHDFTPSDLPLDKPVALMFGTEQEGLSTLAQQMADHFLRIPMAGFTESFNISVSAAVCLYELTNRLKNSDIPWQLSDDQYDELHLAWLKASIKFPELLIKRFYETRLAKH